jgi:hypothetical protein
MKTGPPESFVARMPSLALPPTSKSQASWVPAAPPLARPSSVLVPQLRLLVKAPQVQPLASVPLGNRCPITWVSVRNRPRPKIVIAWLVANDPEYIGTILSVGKAPLI